MSNQKASSSNAVQVTPLRPSVLIPVLEKMFRARLPVLLVGAPGVGKTDCVTQACEQAGMDLLVSHPVVSDPTDYKGMPAVISLEGEAKAEFIPFGDLRQLMNAEKPTVAFLDDLGQAPPTVQAAVMQLLLSRSINGKKISDHVTFAAATNRKSDRAGVSGILEPVKSRFASILNVTVNRDDWFKWAYAHQMPTELIAFINFKPNLLSDFQATAEITNCPTPRTVSNVGRLMNLDMPKDAEFALIEGAVGSGFATEFQQFRKLFGKLPDPDEVLKNPQNFAKGKGNVDWNEMDIVYALCIAVADRVTVKNIGQFFKFLDILPSREYGVLAIKMMVTRDPKLDETSEYAQWTQKHLDYCT